VQVRAVIAQLRLIVPLNPDTEANVRSKVALCPGWTSVGKPEGVSARTTKSPGPLTLVFSCTNIFCFGIDKEDQVWLPVTIHVGHSDPP
jgi:hypothetical protein